MTIDELRDNYARCLLILKHERAMREWNLDKSHSRHNKAVASRKLAEMDTVLATMKELGRRLAIQQQAEVRQESLFQPQVQP